MSLERPGYELAQVLAMPQGPDATVGETIITFPKTEGYSAASFLIRHLSPAIEDENAPRTADIHFVGRSPEGEEIVGTFSATGKPLAETMCYSRFHPDTDTTSAAK